MAKKEKDTRGRKPKYGNQKTRVIAVRVPESEKDRLQPIIKNVVDRECKSGDD